MKGSVMATNYFAADPVVLGCRETKAANRTTMLTVTRPIQTMILDLVAG